MKKIKIGEKHNICGERLQKMRKRRNLSQEDLAVKLQLNRVGSDTEDNQQN